MPGASPGPHVRSPPSPPGGCLSFLVSPDFFPSVHTAPAVTLAFSGPPPSALQGAPPTPQQALPVQLPVPTPHLSAGAHESPDVEALPKSKSFLRSSIIPLTLFLSRPVQRRPSLPEGASPRTASGVHRGHPAASADARPHFAGSHSRRASPSLPPPPTDGCAVTVPVSSSVPQLLLSASLLPPSRRTAPACLG